MLRSTNALRRALLTAAIAFGCSAIGAAQSIQPSDTQIDTVNATASSELNPYSPMNGHPYRHGVVPTIEGHKAMQEWKTAHLAAAATSANTLYFGGGTHGVGVLSGHAKVYLVFYGNQWGTQSTDANGNLKFSGDPDGVAPVAQQMFKGIGTGNELWSAELTQWCDGPNVATGAASCPTNGNFIPYQSGGVLAGVWYDNSAASPAAATAHQLGLEGLAAAHHFGNTTAASNRYTYYVIMSPHGTNPDNYQGQYCAWHDWNGDASVTSDVGDFAFSNQPYNTDSGAGCGVGFVNNPGTLDGYTMTLGHEWHETMSDQFPAGGWTASSGSENSDECAWIRAGQPGGAANVVMGNGTYTEQASWSNDTNACAISHPIVTQGGTPTASFSFTTNGLTANFTDSSTDAGGTIGSHAWTFGDGGTSTAASPSHTYAAAGTYSVTETVTDSTDSKTSSKTASVTVSATSQNIVAASSGLCLNVANNTWGTGVIQSPCATTGNEEWTLVPVGSYYHIVAKGSGLCLNVPGSSTTQGTQLIQWGCQGSGSTNDQWSLVAVGGRYHIVSRSSSLCVNISDNSGSSGGKVIQWGCQSASVLNDQFTFH